MRYTFIFHSVFLALMLAGCAQKNVTYQKPENPQHLTDSPDLTPFKTLEVTSNSTSKREVGQASYILDGAHLEVRFPEATSSQRLYVQVEDCRNSVDPLCQRRFVLSGDLFVFAARLKCYIQIRNDTNSGYPGQALQGLCQDTNSRTFAITLSR